MLRDFLAGIAAYGTSLQLISKLKLWRFVIAPGLLSLLLGIGMIWLAIGVSDDIGGWLISLYPFEWGKNILEKIADIFGGLLVIAVGLILFKNIILAIAAPIMSPLSEKVEKALTGSSGTTGFSLSQVISDFIRGIRISIRLIVRELFFTLFLLLIGLIPIFSPFVAIAIFFVQAYYAGAGNMDFALERHFRVRGSVQFVRKHRFLAIGNGAVYLLILLSGVGFLFALPLGVVAATVETVKRLDATK